MTDSTRARGWVPAISVMVGCLAVTAAIACPSATGRTENMQASHEAANCGKKSSPSLAASEEIRIYAVADSPGLGSVYGCMQPMGRPMKLGPERANRSHGIWSAVLVRPVLAAGFWMAARELRQVGRDLTDLLSTGRSVKSGNRSQCSLGSMHHPGEVALRRMVLSPYGATAAIVDKPGDGGGRSLQLIVCSKSRQRLLDDDPHIKPTSLRFDGAILSWVDSEGAESATIR